MKKGGDKYFVLKKIKDMIEEAIPWMDGWIPNLMGYHGFCIVKVLFRHLEKSAQCCRDM